MGCLPLYGGETCPSAKGVVYGQCPVTLCPLFPVDIRFRQGCNENTAWRMPRMQTDEPRIRWQEMVADLAKITSRAQLARRLSVSPKEISRWIAGTSLPQGHNAAKLLEEAKLNFVSWQKYAGVPPAYDLHHSFEKNANDGPSSLMDYEGGIPSIPARFLDLELNSPIGVPASVLTLDSRWIVPLSRLGFDVLTYKTVRTKRVPAHAFPNCAYLPELTSALRVAVQDRPELCVRGLRPSVPSGS